MLTAEQLARRLAVDLHAGARVCSLDVLPSNLRLVVERDFGTDARLLAHATSSMLRVISAWGVVDIHETAWILREVPPGISAADVQARVEVPLLCRPDLAEIKLDDTL